MRIVDATITYVITFITVFLVCLIMLRVKIASALLISIITAMIAYLIYYSPSSLVLEEFSWMVIFYVLVMFFSVVYVFIYSFGRACVDFKY